MTTAHVFSKTALMAILISALTAGNAWAWEDSNDADAVETAFESDDGDEESTSDKSDDEAADEGGGDGDEDAAPMKKKNEDSGRDDGGAKKSPDSDKNAASDEDSDEEDGDAKSSSSSKAKSSAKAKPVVDDTYDDADLYPASYRKPSKQNSKKYSDDDDDDDSDGWIGVGERRQPVSEDEDEDDDGDDESSGKKNKKSRSSGEPWFGQSFFDERHLGLTAELTLGGYFRQTSLGDLDGKFALGLAASWNLGKLFFDEDMFLNRGLWIQLSWLYPFNASGEKGTEMVQVTQSQHNLTLSAMVGYPLWKLLVYGKIGPSLYVGSIEYDVAGSKASWSSVRGGLTYGAGVHTMFFVCDYIALSGRIELLGQRRSYYNELQLTVNLGAAF